LGLVVGLKGTGDGNIPATRALAQMMASMGQPLGQSGNGTVALDELKNAKNVALVFVTATVPADLPAGEHALGFKVTAQACDDKTCLAPAYLPVAIKLTVE